MVGEKVAENNKTIVMGKGRQRLLVLIFVIYVLILFCSAIILRHPHDDNIILTDWFWGYHCSEKYIIWDNVYNIVAFIPVGLLIGFILSKYRILIAFFVGLFLSETFECAQLIWKRGSFDVDDLFNNIVGTLIGGLIAVLITQLVKRNKE